MEKWLSISELSELTKIPETTIRRYISKFRAYFRYDTRGRTKKYHPDTIMILKKIADLYNEDYQAPEIDDILGIQFPFAVEEKPTTHHPPLKTIEQQFEDFKTYQEQFNRQLLQELHQQREYIKNSIDKRDHDLLNAIQQMQDAKKEIAAAKEKKWWQFWR
ncbi:MULTISPECIES: DUF3967 domain-containing protein [Bacillaceae]|uniref:HTH merR-type domain-containing protein n=1 Tax=Oceanobacillus caeni TaxID=405946 RepID=A0ABR5MFE4_9BACI|nr:MULTISPECIES: DUF3967 domain-containing protein [Bacillaceae]KPH69847.1 hypothetical protein AFL42_16915 [Oceanobacillus caeni]HAJ4038281.1 MerR family transcriptional regulator [Escherichia coli]